MQKNVPTYVQIYEDIYSKIINGVYKEGDKLPTEAELCKTYYVSRITVKNALQKLVEKGLISRIAGRGTFVSAARADVSFDPYAKIGLIMCDFGVSYGMELVRSIEKEVGKLGKNLVLKNSRFDKELETKAINELLAQSVEGIILQPTHNNYFNREVLKLALNKYPIVIIDRELKSIDLPYVGTDNSASMQKAMEYLFAKGHRNICFMSGTPQNTSTIESRLDGFRKAYVYNSFANNINNEFFDIRSTSRQSTPQMIEEDIQRIHKHLTDNPQITCVFAGEYAVCSLVKQAVRRMGKSIPEDISLITFDNISDPFYFTNTTYVKQNEKEIGKKAVELLMQCKLNGMSGTHIYMSCDLIEHDSVKDLSKG